MSTYTFQQGVDYVSKLVKGIPTVSLDAIACDSINSIIWRSWYWRWSVTSLTSITAVQGTQDYSISNNDFMRIWRLRLTRTDITPNTIRDIEVLSWIAPNIEQTGTIDTIYAGSYIDTLAKLRLDKAASVPTGVTWQIDGDYQKLPTKVSATSQVIPFPDHYFDVLVEGLTWKYYKLGDDPRAGEIQADKTSGNRTYTGQLGTFYNALREMMESEGFGYGDSQLFPDSPLGVGRLSNPGLFGWS